MLLSSNFLMKYLLIGYIVSLPGLYSCKQHMISEDQASGNSYYLSASGNDANDGSKTKPWKTIAPLNTRKLEAGDTVYFEGGQVFAGSILLDSGDKGLKEKPVVLTSFGSGKAHINAGNNAALTLFETEYVRITNLAFTGSGRKTGNTKDGVVINGCKNIYIDSLDINGFQKSGLNIYISADIEANRVYAYENGFAGISVSGIYGNKKSCRNIVLRNCTAENNPGDPTNLTNHSGNGIVAGFCTGVTIEHCAATNNGWDMPRQGNGPVGIWAWEADSAVIQHCISYRNKTSPGAKDGGGFDLDGGVTNSIIQYCLSYENQGSGFGIFQYAGASTWNNNIVRFNISENDGSVTVGCGGILVWNNSGSADQFSNCLVYNNTIFNSKAPAIVYANESPYTGFRFYNNIFVGKDSIVEGHETNSTYLGNNWYSLASTFNIGGFTSFQTWANSLHKEMNNGLVMGHNIDPAFSNPGAATLVLPGQLTGFNNYQLPAGSPLRTGGIDLSSVGIAAGGKAFNQNTAPVKGVGACF
jgi:Right handed beta helix region